MHFCYVEAYRKSHNVGVQHLLIGFHVVTIFRKGIFPRKDAGGSVVHVTEKVSSLINLIYCCRDAVTLPLGIFPFLIRCSDLLSANFYCKFCTPDCTSD